MAYIPYGYKIENGKAVIDQNAAQQLKDLFKGYLSGLSVKNALEQSGIPMSLGSAKHMLKNTTYLGDDYYPRIIDDDTFRLTGQERVRRSAIFVHPKKSNKVLKIIQVRTHFQMDIDPHPGASTYDLTPSQRAAFLYSCIKPCKDGGTKIDDDDNEKVRAWMSKNSKS